MVDLFGNNSAASISIEADPSKLSIAVLNLLDNAVKFNKSNGIIRISASQLKSRSIGVAISDTGIGIPQGKLDEIYSPFTQVDMSSTREHQGVDVMFNHQTPSFFDSPCPFLRRNRHDLLSP